MDVGAGKMAGLPEFEAFEDIVDAAKSSKQQLDLVNTRLKTSKIYVNKYEEKLNGLKSANERLRKDLNILIANNANYKTTLETLQNTTSLLQDNNSILRNTLLEVKEYNKKITKDTDDTIEEYKKRLIENIGRYEHSPLAIKRNALKKNVKILELKLMMKNNDLKNIQQSLTMYKNIRSKKLQPSIVSFAEYVLNIDKKRKLIMQLKTDIRFKEQEYEKYVYDKNEILKIIQSNTLLNKIKLASNLPKNTLKQDVCLGLPALNFTPNNMLSLNFSTDKKYPDTHENEAKCIQQPITVNKSSNSNAVYENIHAVKNPYVPEADKNLVVIENSPKMIKIENFIEDDKKIKVLKNILLTDKETINLLHGKCNTNNYINIIKPRISLTDEKASLVKSCDVTNIVSDHVMDCKANENYSVSINSNSANKKVHFNDELTIIDEKLDENQFSTKAECVLLPNINLHNDDIVPVVNANESNVKCNEIVEHVEPEKDLNIEYKHNEETFKSEYDSSTSKYFAPKNVTPPIRNAAVVNMEIRNDKVLNADFAQKLSQISIDTRNVSQNRILSMSGYTQNTSIDSSNYKSMPSTAMTDTDAETTGIENSLSNQNKIDSICNFIDQCEPFSPAVYGSPLGVDYDNFYKNFIGTSHSYLTSPTKSNASLTSSINRDHKRDLPDDMDESKFLFNADKHENTSGSFFNTTTEKAKNKNPFFNFF